MGTANERCYIVTPSLNGWAHTQNDPRNTILYAQIKQAIHKKNYKIYKKIF